MATMDSTTTIGNTSSTTIANNQLKNDNTMDDGVSDQLSLVDQLMYFRDGFVYPGDEHKVAQLEKQIDDWERDVVNKEVPLPGKKVPTRQSMASDLWKLMFGGDGYWCQGSECECERTHWVRQSADYFCYECMHDPCACRPPLMWDDAEVAYYRINSRNRKTPQKIWMSIPNSTTQVKKWWRDKQKVTEYEDRMEEIRVCHEEQEEAQNKGFCCHMHAVKKREEKKEENMKKKAKTVDGPHHCIFCDEDPCAFIQIQSDLCVNDDIYYVTGDYETDPIACNEVRHDRAYKYAAFILWNKRGYVGKHYGCVESGVKSLFPVDDSVITGFEKKLE